MGIYGIPYCLAFLELINRSYILESQQDHTAAWSSIFYENVCITLAFD